MANFTINELQERILKSFTFAYILLDENSNPVFKNDLFSKYFQLENDSANYFFIQDIKERIDDVFKTGNESAMFLNKPNGKSLKLNFTPVLSNKKQTEFVLCSIIENSDKSNWQKEFNLLFEKVPCYISIIDKNLKIIRSNDKYRDTFGDNHSVFHTEMSKKKAFDIGIAPSVIAFNEGIEHISYQVGQTKDSMKCHLIVNSIPINSNLVMEIANDITELNQLQEQLHQAHDFYNELIEKNKDGIIAIDDKGKVQILNESARKILNIKTNRKPNINKILNQIPADFFKEPDVNGVIIANKDILIKGDNDQSTPVRINAYEIANKKNSIGRVAYLQDMTQIANLEKEKKEIENQAISATFKVLEENTMQIIKNGLADFENFEKELFKNDKEKILKAWQVFKFKNYVTNEIIAAFIELSVGYTPSYERINLEEFLKENIKDFVNWANYDNIKFEFDMKGELNNINTDLRMFKILIKTLINNGLLSAKLNPENPYLHIKIENNSKYLAVEVHDNGPYSQIENIDLMDIQKNKNVRYGMLTLNLLVNRCGGSILSTSSLYDGNKIKIVLPL